MLVSKDVKKQLNTNKKAARQKSPKRVSQKADKANIHERVSHNAEQKNQIESSSRKANKIVPTKRMPHNVAIQNPPIHISNNDTQISQLKHTPHKVIQTMTPKRIPHKVARRRRMLKRFISFALAFILLAICVVVSLKLLFIVRTVEVNGSELFSQQDISTFCAIPPESNIFNVKTKELEKKIAEEFTYIETVKVQKKLPDKIKITIIDSVESFYAVSEEKINIYSQSFKFLRTADIAPNDILKVEFDMQNKEILSMINHVVELLKAEEIVGMTSLSILNINDIKMSYDNRLEINFGTMLDIDHKLKMCKKLIEEKIPKEESGVLDATKAGEIVYKRN